MISKANITKFMAINVLILLAFTIMCSNNCISYSVYCSKDFEVFVDNIYSYLPWVFSTDNTPSKDLTQFFRLLY